MKTREQDPAQQDVFDNGVRARTSDPSTSKAAAKSVVGRRNSHKRVLAMFNAYGDMTDDTLASFLDEAATESGFKQMSPSGVRSRRSELAKPNIDRMGEMAREAYHVALDYWDCDTEQQQALRARLLVEGPRSPLWDTGKREALPSGRLAIVWGIAK